MVIEGLWWCTYKGVLLFSPLHLPKRKRDKLKFNWGFHHPRLHGFDGLRESIYVLREDTWLEQTTLPRGGKKHHRTDLIVEWVNLSAQRGAKFLCALYPVFLLIGIAIGWGIATHL